MIFSDLKPIFQGRDIIQRQITQKRYKIELYLQWRTNRKLYYDYRTATFSMTFNDHYLHIQGLAILWRWISHKRYDIHSFNEILIGTYRRPTQQCHFEWPWVILRYLAKYSMTRSVARSLCDSWASCLRRATMLNSLSKANKYLINNRSEPENYTKTA